jgi:hypothetical protein
MRFLSSDKENKKDSTSLGFLLQYLFIWCFAILSPQIFKKLEDLITSSIFSGGISVTTIQSKVSMYVSSSYNFIVFMVFIKLINLQHLMFFL